MRKSKGMKTSSPLNLQRLIKIEFSKPSMSLLVLSRHSILSYHLDYIYKELKLSIGFRISMNLKMLHTISAAIHCWSMKRSFLIQRRSFLHWTWLFPQSLHWHALDKRILTLWWWILSHIVRDYWRSLVSARLSPSHHHCITVITRRTVKK
jgi:hypothetical protein